MPPPLLHTTTECCCVSCIRHAHINGSACSHRISCSLADPCRLRHEGCMVGTRIMDTTATSSSQWGCMPACQVQTRAHTLLHAQRRCMHAKSTFAKLNDCASLTRRAKQHGPCHSPSCFCIVEGYHGLHEPEEWHTASPIRHVAMPSAQIRAPPPDAGLPDCTQHAASSSQWHSGLHRLTTLALKRPQPACMYNSRPENHISPWVALHHAAAAFNREVHCCCAPIQGRRTHKAATIQHEPPTVKQPASFHARWWC